MDNSYEQSQGRCRLFESGTAIEHFRFSPSAQGTSGGGGGGKTKRGGGVTPLSKGGSGDLPKENFVIQDD